MSLSKLTFGCLPMWTTDFRRTNTVNGIELSIEAVENVLLSGRTYITYAHYGRECA